MLIFSTPFVIRTLKYTTKQNSLLSVTFLPATHITTIFAVHWLTRRKPHMETLSPANLQLSTNILLHLQMKGQLVQCVLILFNNIAVLKTQCNLSKSWSTGLENCHSRMNERMNETHCYTAVMSCFE